MSEVSCKKALNHAPHVAKRTRNGVAMGAQIADKPWKWSYCDWDCHGLHKYR